MSDRQNFQPLHQDPKECFEEMFHDTNISFKYTRLYYNNTTMPVHVMHRNNICVPIRNTLSLNYLSGDFVVRSSWNFTGATIIGDVMKSIKAVTQNFNLESEEVKLFNKRLVDQLAHNHSYPKVTIILDRVISARVIREAGAVYLHDEDLLICDSDNACKSLHPYSSDGVTDPSYYDFITENKVSGFFVEVVDNENNTSVRYMYSGKRLVEVRSVQDPARRSGVYYHHATHHRLTGAELERGDCTLEEAEAAIGLYKTRDEAATGGNPENVSRIELEKAKKDAVQANLELEKSRHETAMAKEETERIKLERADHFEEKKYRRSDEYDHRSTNRKDSSDVLKLSIALASGAAAMFALMRSSNK